MKERGVRADEMSFRSRGFSPRAGTAAGEALEAVAFRLETGIRLRYTESLFSLREPNRPEKEEYDGIRPGNRARRVDETH